MLEKQISMILTFDFNIHAAFCLLKTLNFFLLKLVCIFVCNTRMNSNHQSLNPTKKVFVIFLHKCAKVSGSFHKKFHVDSFIC